MRVFLPAGLRRRFISVLALALTLSSAGPTHATGSGCLAQNVTSLPPIETVMRPMWPRCLETNFVAAATCVLPAYLGAPGPRPAHFFVRLRIDTVVSPLQPKLTSLSL